MAGILVTAIAALGVVLWLHHRYATRRERRRFPPPGELVDIGGQRLHLLRMGTGGPTVVLDSALASSSLSWTEIQPRIAEITTVVSYDRAGFGWSDPARRPRTIDNLVDELERLLERAPVEPPYVLVGHSYGGWIAQLYASRHRDQVAGLVLVDVPHPKHWSEPDATQRARVARGARLARRGALFARFGLVRWILMLERVRAFDDNGRITALLGKTPPAIRAPLRSFWVRASTLQALASQIENAPASAAVVISERGELGDIPLVVLTAADADPMRLDEERETAALSHAGRHVVASRGGHWIPFEEPELIADAIRAVVGAAR